MMRRDEIVSLQWAVDYAGKDVKTVRRLCKSYGVSRQTYPSAPLEIHRVGLEMALAGDETAIEMLRSGQRDHPVIQVYYAHCGVDI